MRVALVSQEYPPDTAHGGIATQTHLKAHGLAARGHDVVVVSRSTTGSRSDREVEGVRVVRLPAAELREPELAEPAAWVANAAAVAAELAALHAEAALDVVDFPEWAAEGFVHLVTRDGAGGPKALVQLHGPLVMLAGTIGWPEPDSELHRAGTWLEGTALRLADGVYSSSGVSADWCARAYGLDRERIPTLHLGVDTARFRPLEQPKTTRPTVVYAGKLVPNKGAGEVVDAVLSLRDRVPGIELLLAGRREGVFAGELARRVDAAGATGRVRFLGHLEPGRLADELATAHVFAAPSRYEGGPGFVYLEAMACGLPVVACAGSGVAEVVRHGDNGLLVPPGDAAGVAAALETLLCDPVAAAEMGARARRYVLETADTRRCAARLEALYETVLAGRAPRR